MKTETSVKEEEIQIIPWDQLIRDKFREYKIKRNSDLKEIYPIINSLEHLLLKMPQKITQETKSLFPQFLQCLLAIKYDIAMLLMQDSQQNNLMIITIQMLELIKTHTYLYDEYQDILLEIFACLNLKECSQQLLINDQYFRNTLKKWLKFNFLDEIITIYNPLCEIVFTIIIMMTAHFDFIDKPDYEFIELVITCFKYARELSIKTEKAKQEMEEKERLLSKNRKALQILQQELPAEERYQQVPKITYDLLIVGLALIPNKICQMSTRQKFTIHSDLLKTKNIDIFRLTLAHKISQTLIFEFKQGELMNENDLLNKQLDLARMHEYFTQPRECIKAINMLLTGNDDAIIWIKFDSDNFFDNSNQNIISIHGDPLKLQSDQGLFFDGCGASFELGSCLELENPLRINNNAITVCFWMVMFATENSRQRSQAIDFSIRTLICAKDGITPIIFTDSYSQIFGVTNISQEKEHQSLGLKFFKQKDQNKTYQGWNHITVILDNMESSCYLYLNGQFESSLNGIQTNFKDIKFIANSGNFRQPFGYICDFRIYDKVLPDSDIKKMCFYDKHQVKLQHNDIFSLFLKDQKLLEVKRLIVEYSNKNGETCAQLLTTVAKLCQSGTIFRLEAAKHNLFEQISLLLYNSNQEIQEAAAKALNAMR